MERAKKMVLISTENLERMQQQQQQKSASFAVESKENTTPRNPVNEENENNSVQTPGTLLTRLDAEMSRILNSAYPRNEDERWKMYREVLWRYLHYIREARKQNAANETEITDNEARLPEEIDNAIDSESTLVSHDISRKLQTSAKLSHLSGIDDTVIEKNHSIRMLKSSKNIVESVPKSYRAQARLLMKHLLDNAVPDRINWDEDGVVTINGNIVKDSNIVELINDAMRERKTVKPPSGRAQFARLLRSLNTRSSLLGNKRLLNATSAFSSSNIEKPQPTASSTPIVKRVRPTALKKLRTRKRKKCEQEEEKASNCTLFLSSRFRKVYPPSTFIKNVDSLPARKRRLLDWSTLKK
jgi:hypothetical protein